MNKQTNQTIKKQTNKTTNKHTNKQKLNEQTHTQQTTTTNK